MQLINNSYASKEQIKLKENFRERFIFKEIGIGLQSIITIYNIP